MSSHPTRLSAAVHWLLVHPWLIVLSVGALAVAVWAYGTRQVPHRVRAVFAEAPGLYTGEDVQVDEIDAGKVTSVTYSAGKAIVGVGIQDMSYWPLHQGTTVTLRYGTTVGNGTRYIQLEPGPKSAPAIPENGIIGDNHTVDGVEFDQLFGTFNARTRAQFRRAMGGMGAVVGARTSQIGAAVRQTGPALGSISGFASELARDQQSLETLVVSGAEVTSALSAHDAQISDLVSNAAGTFHAFASDTSGVADSIDQLPATLTHARGTLARLDTSIGHLNRLVTNLAPGAVRLGALSTNLLRAMTDLRATIPIANRTFTVGTRAAPRITRLLQVAQPFSTAAAPAFTSLAPMVGCIRPYAPEIAGLLSTWSSWTKNYDGIGHLGRLWGNVGPSSLTSTPLTPQQYVRATGQGYALIRPPGYDDGQRAYLPECGVTPAGLNPADAP
jgi:phospholipid/cholesterol/gamma-HCH transport system substrate-binding protein